MGIWILLSGLFAFVFFLLAGLNGAKKWIKAPWFRKWTSKHRLFGMLSGGFAFVHMGLNVINDTLRLTGAFALIGVMATGLLGMLFFKLKQKKWYVLHRIIGASTLILMVIHIVFNHAI